GLALAVASLKPTFGIPLLLLMLCRRNFRAAGIGVLLGSAGALLAAAWIYLHDDQLLHSFQASHDAIVADADVDPTSAWMRTDLLSVITRFSDKTTDGVLELAFMLLVLLPGGLSVWRVTRQLPAPGGIGISDAIIY